MSSAQAPGADQQGTFVVAVNDDHPAGEPIESVATLPTRGDRNPADNRSPALEAGVRLSAEYDALPQGGLITYTIILDNSEESSQRVTVEVTPDANTTFVPAGSDAAWVEEAGVQRASFFVDCGFCSNQFTLVVAVARLGSGAATGRRCTAIGPGVVQRKRPGGRVRWLGGGSRRGLSGGGCADRLMAEVGRCVGEPSRAVAREAWPDYPRGIGLWLAGWGDAMSHEPVGVLIIGAGASGGAFAWSIADLGMSVLCLEQGPWVKQSDLPTNGMDWEARGLGQYAPDPNVRQLPADYPVNSSESAITPVMYNAVGGSTILWAAHFPRLRPRDFTVRTDDGVAADWPIRYETLEPFFARNDQMMGVSGLAGDPAYPYHEPPLPPLPLGRGGNRIARGFESLGWHWWPSDSAIISRAYEGREPCINLGACVSGCTQGAKASTDITYWPVAQRKGVQIRTGCRVQQITLDEDGLADGVLYFDEDGALQEQKAEIVVVACNGIGTPRLLLNSRSDRFPDGLANSSGLVGKNLMFHPVGYVAGIFDEPLDGRAGPDGCALWSHEFMPSDPSRGFVRGYQFQIGRSDGPASTALVGGAQGPVAWGKEHHASFARIFNHTASIGIMAEDLPEETNSVTLDPELTDSNGIPAPKITYTVSENSRKMLAHGLEKAEQVIRAAGASDVVVGPHVRVAGWHLLGTARMGTDPQTSVVNEWGRAHDVKNLFVIDGSVFVTAGAVNPTSTIQAIALYVADSMKRNVERLLD